MTDHFLAIPDQMIGTTLFPQDAIDWLAFGPPEQEGRSGLSLDDQILCAHTAAGSLLMAMWGGDLPAYVWSPSLSTWYQVPAIYWGRQTPETMQSAIKRPDIPDRLPGQPRPIHPRYEINVAVYPHQLPAGDLVGQLIAFRKADVERHCQIAAPVFQCKLKTPAGPSWSLYEAAAWIATGDASLVAQLAELYERHPTPKDAGAVTWLNLQRILESRDPAPLMGLADAQRTLRAACESGTVAASGVTLINESPLSYSDRRTIPAADFIGVELWPGKGGSLHRIIQGRGEAGRWFELRFSETDVRGIAGTPPSVAQQPSEPSSSFQQPTAPPQPAQPWTEAEMTRAMKAWVIEASSRDREAAWRDHFRALQPEHGWSNQSFRDHWSIANDSVGKPGPVKSAQ